MLYYIVCSNADIKNGTKYLQCLYHLLYKIVSLKDIFTLISLFPNNLANCWCAQEREQQGINLSEKTYLLWIAFDLRQFRLHATSKISLQTQKLNDYVSSRPPRCLQTCFPEIFRISFSWVSLLLCCHSAAAVAESNLWKVTHWSFVKLIKLY